MKPLILADGLFRLSLTASEADSRSHRGPSSTKKSLNAAGWAELYDVDSYESVKLEMY